MPVKKITLPNGTVLDIEDSKIFRGTCSTAAATYTKTVVCPEFTADDLVAGVLVLVKFDYTNTRTGTSVKLNVNGTGAYTVYSFSSGSRSGLASAATMNAAFPNLFVFCGDSWQILSYNTNTTYTAMTQAEIDAGTQTGARLISPKLLRDNFFTDADVDSAPTANSTNLVTSGGVKTAVDSKQDTDYVITATISGTTFTITSGSLSGALAAYGNDSRILLDVSQTTSNETEHFVVPAFLITGELIMFTYAAAEKSITLGLTSSGLFLVNERTFEETYNKVTSLSSSSTDVQYPSAKAVWDTFYQKPLTGIPEDDLDAAVNNGLVYIATKGTTPVADIEAAFDAGKYIILISGTTRMRLEYGDSSSIAFECLSWSGSTLRKFRTTLNRSTGVFSDTASNIQSTSGRTSSWTATPNNDRYPSEKLVKDSLDLKEDTANKVTSLSSSSTDTEYPSAKCVYYDIHPLTESINPSNGFLPNQLYSLGTVQGSVSFSLATPPDSNIMNHYYWTFRTGSTAPTITWPSGITWFKGQAPTINSNKYYEISVLDGIAVFMEV